MITKRDGDGTYTHTEVRMYIDGYLVCWGAADSIPDAARWDIECETDKDHDPYGSYSNVRVLIVQQDRDAT